MGVQSIAGNRLSLIIRAAALTVGLSTYLISPDDVVWRFIKTVPNARVLEHAVFVIAAVIIQRYADRSSCRRTVRNDSFGLRRSECPNVPEALKLALPLCNCRLIRPPASYPRFSGNGSDFRQRFGDGFRVRNQAIVVCVRQCAD